MPANKKYNAIVSKSGWFAVTSLAYCTSTGNSCIIKGTVLTVIGDKYIIHIYKGVRGWGVIRNVDIQLNMGDKIAVSLSSHWVPFI